MDLAELSVRLAAIAEELADQALDRLHEAAAQVAEGASPSPTLIAEERRITRARRAVEKAASLLSEPAGSEREDG